MQNMDDFIKSWLKGWFSAVKNVGLTEERQETLLNFIHNHMVRYDWATMTQDERILIVREAEKRGYKLGTGFEDEIANIRDEILLNMNTEEKQTPKWVKVNKGFVFTEDVLFANYEELFVKKHFSNIIHAKGCKAQEDGYYLVYNSLANLPTE